MHSETIFKVLKVGALQRIKSAKSFAIT